MREAGVYTEILPWTTDPGKIRPPPPTALSYLVVQTRLPLPIRHVRRKSCLILVCRCLAFVMASKPCAPSWGGGSNPEQSREFGRALLDVATPCALFDGVWGVGSQQTVWIGHGDHVAALPDGFVVVATSAGAPFAVVADESRRYYGVQFHPEVIHTFKGAALLSRFALRICGCSGSWSMAAYRTRAIAAIRAQVGDGRVICGLSGGVDSSVAAVLIHEAIGDQLTCVFVDHGLLRAGEAEEVVALFGSHYKIPLVHKMRRRCFWAGLPV